MCKCGMIAEMIGGSGEIAILSATPQATNQNLWIEWMKKELAENPKMKNVKLVKVAYGDDLRDKSVAEMEGLLKTYPNLKGVIAPTTVGVAAAGKVLTDKGLKGKVQLTGLGPPSEMAEYIESGVCHRMYLWNPLDVGYLPVTQPMGYQRQDHRQSWRQVRGRETWRKERHRGWRGNSGHVGRPLQV